jgi:hypothetical protein
MSYRSSSDPFQTPEPPPPQQNPQRRPQLADPPYIYEEIVEEGDGRGCKGCLWGFAAAGGCFSIPIIAFIVLVLLGINTMDGIFDGIKGIFDPPDTYTFESTNLVLERIQAMSQLTTTRYTFSNIVESQRDLPGVLDTLYRDQLVMVVAGHINAGIDLSKLQPEDITADGATLIVRLPSPQLFDCFINEAQSYVVERNTGLFASESPQLDQQARAFAISEFRNQALENGILNEVNLNATSTLELFLKSLPIEGDAQVQVISSAPDAEAPFPPSCQTE